MEMYYYKRSVGVAILLTFVTCGIYGIYWLYQLLTSLYRLNNLPSNAGLDIVLSIVTCGIYGIYLAYKMGKLESTAHHVMGMPPRDDSILYLILTIFSLGIIVYAIIQSNLNNLVDQVGGHGPHGGPGYGPGPGHPGQGPHGGQQGPWNQN
ncbi:MAG: DUF4234 domain-containing protein [Defluviitaleaceae bacterium]|nr:DUF4234 domain-containing protein [Defluviitaleaceae bacterium]